MKTTIEFIDAVKAARGLTSDYQLSHTLGISRAAVSKYRSGKDYLGEEMAVKIASILEIEPGFVLACVASEKARSPEAKKAWLWFADHMGGLAASVALVAIALQFSPLQGADSFNIALLGTAADAGFLASVSRSLYIMSNNICDYWPLFATLAAIALAGYFHYYPRPKKR